MPTKTSWEDSAVLLCLVCMYLLYYVVQCLAGQRTLLIESLQISHFRLQAKVSLSGLTEYTHILQEVGSQAEEQAPITDVVAKVTMIPSRLA